MIKSSAIYTLSTFTILLSGVLFIVDLTKPLFIPFFALGLGITAMYYFSRGKNRQRTASSDQFGLIVMSIISLILLLLCLVSNIFSLSLPNISRGISLTALLLFVINGFSHFELKVEIMLNSLCKSIFIITSIVMLLCVLKEMPLITGNHFGYSGIFENPNSLGTMITPLFSITTSFIILKSLGIATRYSFFTLSVFCVISGYFVLLSSSRTAFIAGLVPSVVVWGFVAFSKRNNKKRFIKVIASIFWVTIFFIVLYNTTIFQEQFLSKFTRNIEANDVLSGRDDLWRYALTYSHLIGDNTRYSHLAEFGAHNTFLPFLIDYGYIYASIFLLLYVYFVYRSFIFTKRFSYISSEFYLPIIISLNTFLIFMTEQMTTTMNHFLFLIVVSLTYSIRLHSKSRIA